MEAVKTMRYYISDLHFYHQNLLTRMDKRGFQTVEEMHDHMISQWNSRVRKNDEVIILGDLCFTSDGEKANEIISQLKGRKYLITGNHDYYLSSKTFDLSAFGWVEPYREMNDYGRKVILSHYPIICYNGQYRTDSEGNPKVYMLYGHVHNTYDEFLVNQFQTITRNSVRTNDHTGQEFSIPCNMINCFCMFSDYIPLTLDEWIDVDRKRREAMTSPGQEKSVNE